MSRIQQDQFVDDDEDECCPLCVEEFDLSDKNFRPCPCGYQICQFCFNNIKTTMNGLCPACRRPYDESTIEWKNITPEEMSRHKQQIAQKAKKNAQMRQKEAQKAEADSLSRKHLAGLRVVQKNLVYVTGLTPTIREDRLLDTLRGPEYFGQYGKIIKIVVSKARENAQHQSSVGVYVTFARKEDAAQCINAVDGSQNGERTLRAQYGTTKYCSAYLRGEQCNNRNCMFLHEPGEDNDSFTRQDLSMMNSIQTQQPAQSSTSRSAPPAHQGPPVAAAAPMNRQDSNDASSPIDTPGLPATASWGNRAAQERRASRSTNASNPSPMTTNATPAPQVAKTNKGEESQKAKEKEKEKEKEKAKETSTQTSQSATPQPQPQTQPSPAPRPPKPCLPGLENLLKKIINTDFKFVFSNNDLSEEDMKAIKEFPQLLDPNGGAKRRAKKERDEELAAQREAEIQAAAQQSHEPQQQQQQSLPPTETEEHETTAGGSLQLGGEPEESLQTGAGLQAQNQHAIAPPGQPSFGGTIFRQNAEDLSNLGVNNGRGMTPQQQQQQQQQILLQNFKSGPQAGGLMSNFQNNQASQMHGQGGNPSGHTRHTSRFSFANDGAPGSTSVQPVANQKLMNQQNTMMPKNNSHFNQLSQHQSLGGQFYTSGVQGPPPGLKGTGTPPISGGGMFGQGHNFATGSVYGANTAGRNNNDALYQDLIRGNGGARVADAGKRESMFPSFLNQHPTTSTPAPAPGLLSFPYGPSPGAYQESGSQKSKKKGKKHRHANTSSSGGGVVDVQDPSILQARLHQGGGMAGQGLYGQGQGGFSSLNNYNNYGGAGRVHVNISRRLRHGQSIHLTVRSSLSVVLHISPEDQIFSLEEEASINVDALVNDSVADPQGKPATIALQTVDLPRRSTPTIPPGFTAPAVPHAIGAEQLARPLSRSAGPIIAPAVPVVPVTPGQAATSVKTKKSKKVVETAESADHNKDDISTNAESHAVTPPSSSKKSSSVKSKPTQESLKKTVEVAPVITTKENKKSAPSTSKATTPKKTGGVKGGQTAVDISPQKDSKDAPSSVTTPASSKRQHPGKLDIAAATKPAELEQPSVPGWVKSESQVKATRTASTAPNAWTPGSPAAISTGSPVKKTTAARTLRVVATPKTESPSPWSAASTTSHPQVPTVEKLRSRQASIASVNLPGTPVSELVSDTASITSTSISRANSPPPVGGKVGSAPVRKKTKSQQKKERQERARQEEERALAMEEHKSEPEVVQEPLMGRKKKAKKPANNPKPLHVPTKAPPQSPKPVEVEEVNEQAEPPEAPPVATKKPQIRSSTPLRVDPHPPPESKERRETTAQAIIADLQKTGELIASTLEFFKPLSSSLAQSSRPVQSSGGPVSPPDLKMHLSPADVEALSKKQPVRLTGNDGKIDSNTLITPHGKFFWGLTKELEERVLELEKHIDNLKGPGRFHTHRGLSQQHRLASQALPALATALKEAGATLSKSSGQQLDSALLGATALPLPPVQNTSDLPPPQSQAQQQQAPADAGSYLNQFVLPKTDSPVPNSSRTEMAAVGGLPGSGTANMSVNVNKLAKAARAVAEGGAVGTELEGMGVMAADLLGGVFVQGLETLVGAGLDFSTSSQDITLEGNGNVSLNSRGVDVQNLVSAFETGGGLRDLTSRGILGSGKGRRPVLSMDEAEQAMLAAKKDHEALEKKLAAVMKRNKKMVGGSGRA
ncbi:unnamed protein product [Periconia digitata]|uniref:CCR4-NOT transcription complex subunit 4 n=1 Tax=Periconia digitata TaxID=1303443 RepID=A0A9W4U5U1_9PLEO|nr:unnamed protein product [Periconia digitata]